MNGKSYTLNVEWKMEIVYMNSHRVPTSHMWVKYFIMWVVTFFLFDNTSTLKFSPLSKSLLYVTKFLFDKNNLAYFLLVWVH